MTDLLAAIPTLAVAYAAAIVAAVVISTLITVGGIAALIAIWATLAVALIVLMKGDPA